MTSPKLNSFFAISALFAVCFQILGFTVSAQDLRSVKSDETENYETPMVAKSKVAPDLAEEANDVLRGVRGDRVQKVIIQLKSESGINEMFGNDLGENEQQQLLAREVNSNKEKRNLLAADLTAIGGRIKKSYNNLGLVSAELPLSQVQELIKSENVEYISPDREIMSFGHLATTTGWDNPGIADMNDGNPSTWLGGGVGRIAVIDSGIDPNHTLLKWTTDGGLSKVIYNKDFTGQKIAGDPYGHGSHVASMIAGDYTLHNSAYEAVAPGSRLLSLRVLNSNGTGTVSNLVAALDWTVANKTSWNIRVVNMSLGTGAKDSYKNDPLCLAARRAVNAGIVVVASAGNNGKDANGNKVYGSIGSPGIEPSVITVGAANTFGTDSRGDDAVASFSSRGPTRGYVTLANGARKYDNLIKPDLIAPGNKIIGARGYYNGTENLLATTYTVSR